MKKNHKNNSQNTDSDRTAYSVRVGDCGRNKRLDWSRYQNNVVLFGYSAYGISNRNIMRIACTMDLV